MFHARPTVRALFLSVTLFTFHASADEAPAPAPTLPPGFVPGYLKHEDLPDSIALLAPPPAMTSGAEALDQQVARATIALQGGDRFKLAASDADLTFPHAAQTFACVLGASITPEDTPTLYTLLHKALTDAGAATGAAKDKYQHARPFMLDSAPTCTPKSEAALRANGSYPSGHTSIGWAWAEILAEIAPDRANEILERGRAFGESRLFCNVHWASDVIAGRLIGAATVVRLHANPDFLADLATAKAELAAARAKSVAPERDCAAETATLKDTPWLTP